MQPPENQTDTDAGNWPLNLIGLTVALVGGYVVSLTPVGKFISNALGQDLGQLAADRWEIRFIGFLVGFLSGGAVTLILGNYWAKRKAREAAAVADECQETEFTPSDRALRAAIRQRDIARVQALLTEGVDLTTRDRQGQTPLMIAAGAQFPERSIAPPLWRGLAGFCTTWHLGSSAQAGKPPGQARGRDESGENISGKFPEFGRWRT
jgi:hypothetical protein